MDLQDILDKLNSEEKAELAKLLHRELNIPDLELVSKNINENRPIHCPHCHNTEIYGHGSYKGRRRYMCKSCKKTFNDFTGTAVDGIKKLDDFQEYLLLMIESVTIRKAAKKLGVSMQTVFDWRHKILSALEAFNGSNFSGIVECDDKQLDINEKGNRNLERKPFKRASDRETKRGVSNDKISIMVASDRNDKTTMQVAKVGRIDAESVQNTIGGFISTDNILCSDSHPSIIKWAKDKHLEHHTFVASRQHVKNRCYHVQHVNSLDSRYEKWVKRFNGVSTKYLQGYLNWFVFLQKIRKSTIRAQELAKCVINNISALRTYSFIERKYIDLMKLHYIRT
ncbi:MAG: IS1595 family transposase [Chitinophagales bacterium]|nr:IS1595 family transposase [Chitinophagales bacterium]